MLKNRQFNANEPTKTICDTRLRSGGGCYKNENDEVCKTFITEESFPSELFRRFRSIRFFSVQNECISSGCDCEVEFLIVSLMVRRQISFNDNGDAKEMVTGLLINGLLGLTGISRVN